MIITTDLLNKMAILTNFGSWLHQRKGVCNCMINSEGVGCINLNANWSIGTFSNNQFFVSFSEIPGLDNAISALAEIMLDDYLIHVYANWKNWANGVSIENMVEQIVNNKESSLFIILESFPQFKDKLLNLNSSEAEDEMDNL